MCHIKPYINLQKVNTTSTSNEVDLRRELLDLESWLTDRGYKSEIIRLEIQKVNLIDRNNLLKKRPKHQEHCITLIMTFHSALNIVFDVL